MSYNSNMILCSKWTVFVAHITHILVATSLVTKRLPRITDSYLNHEPLKCNYVGDNTMLYLNSLLHDLVLQDQNTL